jgi:hypothetical protein
MSRETDAILIHERLVANYLKAVAAQLVMTGKALTVSCPTCGAKPDKPCGFIALDERFGEDFPLMYTHEARYTAYADSLKQAIGDML